MKHIAQKALLKITALGVVLLALSACESKPTQEYIISITNLTNFQPLSPPVAMLHRDKFNFWNIGETASTELELMAEGGDGSDLLTLKRNNPQYQASAALLPGATTSFTLSTRKDKLKYLSVVGMLVNTNDAFSGINGVELAAMTSGQSSVYYTHAYDAGTEFNSELSGTIPGPADGGEGFNTNRDDVTGVVTLHGGVVSVDDSHADSTLSAADKFDNPTLRIVVTAL